MILGAGYGKRLRPLTELRPKPLVPVGLKPILEWHLDALLALGVDSVALNASHHADQIEGHVGGRAQRSPRVEVIREETPLGTGGGLLGARRLLGREAHFLVINADIFHTIDLGDAVEAHDRAEADATLVVRRVGPDEPQDELTIDANGRVTGISGMGGTATGWRFTGVHVLSPKVFDYLSAPGPLLTGYQGLLADGAKVLAHDCGDALWFDVGTPAEYLTANGAATQMASSRQPVFPGVEIIEPTLTGSSTEIGTGCVIGPWAVIGEHAAIGDGSTLSDCVVWPDVSISPGSVLQGCVAYPGGTLAVVDGA